MEGNGPEALTAADWSALIRSKCTLPILIHCQYWSRGGRALWSTCKSASIHFCHACSYSFACICHNLLSCLKHTMCCWISCKDASFYFEFYTRRGGMAYNYMQIKAALIKHVPHGCWIIFEHLQLFSRGFQQMWRKWRIILGRNLH